MGKKRRHGIETQQTDYGATAMPTEEQIWGEFGITKTIQASWTDVVRRQRAGTIQQPLEVMEFPDIRDRK